MPTLRWIIALFCTLCAFAGTASAVLVDWSALTWSPGSLSNSYDVDPSNAGNYVTVTIGGGAGQLHPSLVSGSPQTPAITRASNRGLGTSPYTFQLATTHTSYA